MPEDTCPSLGKMPTKILSLSTQPLSLLSMLGGMASMAVTGALIKSITSGCFAEALSMMLCKRAPKHSKPSENNILGKIVRF